LTSQEGPWTVECRGEIGIPSRAPNRHGKLSQEPFHVMRSATGCPFANSKKQSRVHARTDMFAFFQPTGLDPTGRLTCTGTQDCIIGRGEAAGCSTPVQKSSCPFEVGRPKRQKVDVMPGKASIRCSCLVLLSSHSFYYSRPLPLRSSNHFSFVRVLSFFLTQLRREPAAQLDREDIATRREIDSKDAEPS